MKTPLVVHERVPHKCASDQQRQLSLMGKLSVAVEVTRKHCCAQRKQQSPRVSVPKHPEIFLLTQNRSPGPSGKGGVETLAPGGEKSGTPEPAPFPQNGLQNESHGVCTHEFKPPRFHALRVGIFTVKQRNLLFSLPPQAPEVKGRTERSAAQADPWTLLFPTLSHQGSGRGGGLTLWEEASRRPNGVGSRRDRKELSR